MDLITLTISLFIIGFMFLAIDTFVNEKRVENGKKPRKVSFYKILSSALITLSVIYLCMAIMIK